MDFVPGEKKPMKPRAIYFVILLTLAFGFTLAAPKRGAAADDDPPSRVARLSTANGEVSFSPAGTDDWVTAEVNRPITTGDKLWTADGARAELHVGSAAVRISGQTGFSFLNLDDQIMQMRLTEGTIYVSVRRIDENESIEVDTPNLAFSISRPGRYRLNVNEAGDTTVIEVRDGEGEVTGGGSSFTVHPGDQAYFIGTDYLSADVQPLQAEDDFDRWVSERDYREEHAVARRYVSEDVIGYEDLDDNGGWRQVPEYGTVWFPHTTIVGWAPYRYGHWAWVSPWGWTWVDDAPWGFAPFHYGRWVSVRGAWGWIPSPPRATGVVYVRPVYAPALVAWVGGPRYAGGVAFAGGGGFAAGVSVGWFPLGPREVFVPSYPVSRRYVNNVNVSNTTVNTTIVNNYYNTTVINKNVTNVRYVNQNVNGAVTATSGQAFTSAQPVGRHMVAVNQREVAAAPAYAAAPAVAPPKQAVLGAGIAARVQPPAAMQNRAVVAKAAPPPAPIPFAQRQQAIQANQGRPISMTQNRQLATQQAQTRQVAAAPVKIAPPPTRTMPVSNVARGNANQAAPPAAANAQAQPNNNNRVAQPVQPNANRPVQPGQPPQPVQPNTNHPAEPVQPNANRPAQPVQPNTSRPSNAPAPATQNPNGNTANNPNGNARNYGDRPQTARPNSSVNPQLEQQHTQQIQQLQQKQDQEYQKLQQQQLQQQKINQQNADKLKQDQLQQKQQQAQQQQQRAQDQQKADQQNAEKLKQQQLQQRQQQLQQQQQAQLQQLQQKQNAERQQLNAKQQAEHAHASDKPVTDKPVADKPAPKPPKKDKEDDHKH
jgi:hypothetical protein